MQGVGAGVFCPPQDWEVKLQGVQATGGFFRTGMGAGVLPRHRRGPRWPHRGSCRAGPQGL